MKANELCVGSFVEFDGSIYMIEEISRNGWVHIMHPNVKVRASLTNDYILNVLEPVKITMELLLNAGFVSYNKYQCHLKIDDKTVECTEYDGEFNVQVIINKPEFGNDVVYNETLNYMHKLQNLLQVFDIDVEFKI